MPCVGALVKPAGRDDVEGSLLVVRARIERETQLARQIEAALGAAEADGSEG